jgi:hypothetical protein
MKLIETTILETTVRMRYADNADPAKATQWIEFQVPNSELKEGIEAHRQSHLGSLATRKLGAIQEAALAYVQDVVGAEIRAVATRQGK